LSGQELFTLSKTFHPDILLGEFPCDIPFSGGDIDMVSVSLTWNSPRSKHGIPVLALEAGHTMYFTSREQTPAGHAAKLVADWLNSHHVDAEQRHLMELFLWQWPGIEKNDTSSQWQLRDEAERSKLVDAPMVDMHGHSVEDVPYDTIINSGNLQANPNGFCRKASPCFLLDACLNCPLFITNKHFIDALKARIPELQQQRNNAAVSNNQRMVESCQLALEAIDNMTSSLKQ
jgi:hypothetical protein